MDRRQAVRKIPVSEEFDTREREAAPTRGLDVEPPAEAGGADVVPASERRPQRVGEAATPVFEEDRAAGLRSRWDAIQASFIDDPRLAVTQAEQLVDEALRCIVEGFERQKRALGSLEPDEQAGTSGDETERMRVTLHRYRAFFVRLLET
jgi:hypothetical protein